MEKEKRKREARYTEIIPFKTDKEQRAKLEEEAERVDLSRSAVIRKAVRNYLN